MARPSEASTPGGTCARHVFRYHATPGRGSELGSVTPAQRWSGKPGRYQPARSPYRPPLLSGRGAGAGAAPPPAGPAVGRETRPGPTRPAPGTGRGGGAGADPVARRFAAERALDAPGDRG